MCSAGPGTVKASCIGLLTGREITLIAFGTPWYNEPNESKEIRNHMSTKRKTIKAYNYVYKIIQLSTGREYIGKHKTDNLNDGYMGSGTLIAPAVDENPSDFIKTIIWYCDSESEMNELEATLVTEDYLLKNFPEKTFNQVPGGDIPLHVSAQWMRKLQPEKMKRKHKHHVRFVVSEEEFNSGITNKQILQAKLKQVIDSGDWPEMFNKYREQYRDLFDNSKAVMSFDDFMSCAAAKHCITGTVSVLQRKILDGFVYNLKTKRFVEPSRRKPKLALTHNQRTKISRRKKF